jgi:cellulose synthase/poly-beta-1,6-N-acetylglucosamine synthase-like glycosyltransferase
MISIIIPARNEEKNIEDVLGSIKKNKYKKKYEIIVIDGKSNDKTREIAKKFGSRIIIQKKLGISNARNLGWKYAKGNILIFIEADHRVSPKFLDAIDKMFQNKNVICGRNEVKVIKKNWIQKALAVQIELATKRQKAWEFPNVFRKEVLKKTGGWDENIDFAEDRELPTRIKKLGYNTVVIKDAILYAKPVDSLSKLLRQGRWYGRNIFSYFNKTRDFVTLFGVFAYSAFIPLLILSPTSFILSVLLAFDFFIFLAYVLKGFVETKSKYAILMIPINIVRGFGELIGMIESFRGGKGKL